ncbi:MAG TPA: hypothetical protein VNH64_04430, partial [Parvularculaceae bacterium]|nr:hypothetical protein [Parvularculaceae bacterium]
GGAALYDFKTGAPPSLKQIQANFNPQLPLTAILAEEGGFEALGRVCVDSFRYVKSLSRTGDRRDFSGAEAAEAREIIEEAREGLRTLVALYDDPDTAYLSQPRPEFTDDYGDYDHLARRREWLGAGGEE